MNYALLVALGLLCMALRTILPTEGARFAVTLLAVVVFVLAMVAAVLWSAVVVGG